jgi:hypothetical protein
VATVAPKIDSFSAPVAVTTGGDYWTVTTVDGSDLAGLMKGTER